MYTTGNLIMEVLLPSLRRRPTTQNPSESVELILPWHERTNYDEKNFFENHLRKRVTPAPSRSHLCLAGNPSRRLSDMTKAMSQ
jgi:hypothetical protein